MGKPSVGRTSAAITVRSAPVSRRNITASQLPPAERAWPRSTGRTMLSSHKYHWPSIRIDPFQSLFRDVTHESAVIFGMGSLSLSDGIQCRIGNKQLLTGDANELAAVLTIDVGS